MCDTFCIRRPGGMLFAKASDRPIDEPQLLEWFAARPVGSPEVRATYRSIPDLGSAGVLGSRPTWMWGVEHGVNEHGVAIGNEKVWTVDDPRGRPEPRPGSDPGPRGAGSRQRGQRRPRTSSRRAWSLMT